MCNEIYAACKQENASVSYPGRYFVARKFLLEPVEEKRGTFFLDRTKDQGENVNSFAVCSHDNIPDKRSNLETVSERGLRMRLLKWRWIVNPSLRYQGPPRAGLRPSGKPELFHSNHSGHTGSIFLNGRSRARVAHWGHQKRERGRWERREGMESEKANISKRS